MYIVLVKERLMCYPNIGDWYAVIYGDDAECEHDKYLVAAYFRHKAEAEKYIELMRNA